MAPFELEAAVDSAAPREELVTLIVKHEKVTRRNDGTMDTPLNNGAMDTPLLNSCFGICTWDMPGCVHCLA